MSLFVDNCLGLRIDFVVYMVFCKIDMAIMQARGGILNNTWNGLIVAQP